MAKGHLSWLYKHYQEICENPILENFLDTKLVKLEEGKSEFKIKTIDRHSNIYGTVHGGTLASICDIAMGTACLTYAKRVVTIDMNISYIKGAPSGSALTATGQVISNGKTIMRSIGCIFDEQGQLLVSSQASYYVTGDFVEHDHP